MDRIKCTMLMALQDTMGMGPSEQVKRLLVLPSDGDVPEDLMGGQDSGLSIVERKVEVNGLNCASPCVSRPVWLWVWAGGR